jgi:hypothetical protein
MKGSACIQARADVRKLRDKVKDMSERAGIAESRCMEAEQQVILLEKEKSELLQELEKVKFELTIFRSSIEEVGKIVGGLLNK